MPHVRKTAFLATIAILGLLDPSGARGDLTVTGDGPPGPGNFGPYGDVNILPSSPPNLAITYGADGQGSVYQMDGYVNVQGKTFSNPGDPSFGPSADLANGPPSGISYTFAASQPTAHQLLLTYQFTNTSGSDLPGFQFLNYVDPGVGATYTNEYATVNGASNLGMGNNPTSFEVSDASSGPIFTNIGNGTLSNTNDLPSTGPTGDVAIALGLTVGTLGVGQTAIFEVLLSDDKSTLGNFSITEVSPDNPGDGLTVSAIVVPEPQSLVLLAIGSLLGLVPLARRRSRVRPGPGPSRSPSSSGRCSSS